jgi:hypothetical protein
MRRHGIARTEIDQFLSECRSSDYDHLLRTCMGAQRQSTLPTSPRALFGLWVILWESRTLTS